MLNAESEQVAAGQCVGEDKMAADAVGLCTSWQRASTGHVR